jgi:hypothetical protein
MKGRRALWVLLLASVSAQPWKANAASCTTQSQMTAAQREALSNAAHTIVADVQSGDMQGVRAMAAPAVAADFQGMTGSISHLEPLVKSAAITVDELYLLDATGNPSNTTGMDFFCGSPVVALSFTGLPAGTCALAIVHATGVPKPQQISLIMPNVPGRGWMLGAMMAKPMIEAAHDGLWYWTSARKYAQTKLDWDAWFYYRIAADLLDPLDSLSSPNLEKLQREANQIRPSDLPGAAPMSFNEQGNLFKVTAIDTSTELGGLDLDVHYTPDATQAAQLRDPIAARQQVTAVMGALLKMHPGLQQAFHGIWVHADQRTSSLFALELPMQQITAGVSVPGSAADAAGH